MLPKGTSATVDRSVGESAVSFYAKSCVVSFFLGLSTVMLIYGTGIGSYNSAVCRQRYNYPVERLGYSVLYLPIPILAGVGLLLGLGGFVHGISVRPLNERGIDNAQTGRGSRNVVLCLPLFIAGWIIVAIMFVAFIPEVV